MARGKIAQGEVYSMGGKSKDQKQIEDLKAECAHWRALALQHSAEIERLTAELERTGMYASAFKNGMQDLDKSIEGVQLERNWYRDRFKILVNVFKPILTHLLPEWFDARLPDGRIVSIAEEKQKWLEGEPAFEGIEQAKGVPTQNPILRTAAVIIGVNNGTHEIEAVHANIGYFPGTVDELKRAADRYFIAVGNKAPTEATGRNMEIYRISHDRQLMAIQQLVITYFDPIASEFFGEALDSVYNRDIKPYLDEYADPDGAREAFRQSAKHTLSNFAKANNFEHPEITLKPGRPKKTKNDSEVNS